MNWQFRIIRRKYFYIMFSMIVVISLAVAMLFGISNGVSSVHKSVDNYIKDNNYPDIKIITNLENIDLLKIFENKDYNLDSRVSITTIMYKNDETLSVKLSTYNDIKDFYIWDKISNNTNYHDILVEKKFSLNNNINLGDILSIKIGDDNYNFFVSSIVMTPEALITTPLSGIWTSLNDYGNVYIDNSILKEETDKLKDKVYNESIEKIEDLENNGKKEYNIALEKINKLLDEYNKEKLKYESIKIELNDKKDELNYKYQLLNDIKNIYVIYTNYLDNINSKIDTYINSYDTLSDNSKIIINNIIDAKYPNISISDIELYFDIAYNLVSNKVDYIFDPSTDINKNIKSNILIADTIKIFLEEEYQFHTSSSVTDLIERIENGMDYDIDLYNDVKSRLSIYTKDLVTDDNFIYIEKIVINVLEEIYNISNKLPFETFNSFYDFLDTARNYMPIFYDKLKEKINPVIENKINTFNEGKTIIKNKLDAIYNSNDNIINKTKLIKDLLYNYVRSNIDNTIVSYLDDNSNSDVISILNNQIDMISNGINDIDNSINKIDSSLKSSYQLIEDNKNNLNNNYRNFLKTIEDAKKDLDSDISNLKGLDSMFNEINIQVDFKDLDSLLKEIKDNELNNIEILDSFTYNYSPLKKTVDYNIVGVEKVSTITPIIFYIIIMIVLFLFISLIIKQSKKEIAIFRLLGISKNRIRLAYIMSNFIISLIGIVLGFIIGYFLMIYIVNYYKEFFMLPSIIYVFNKYSIILSFVITIIVVEISTILATLELDKITPIDVLNKEKYQNNDISHFTKCITNMFNPLRKFSLIVYLRNKKNLIIGITSTVAIVAIIFTSLAYVASKDKILSEYFDDRINYDIELFMKDDISIDYLNEIKSLDYVYNASILKYYNTTIKHNDKDTYVTINALDNKDNYIKIYDEKHKELNYPKEGVVLESHIASKLGVSKGDFVTIDGISFMVSDISFQSMARVNYISYNDYNKLDSSFNSIVIKMDTSKEKEFINKVSKDDNYIYTISYDNLKKYNKKEFDSYTIPAIIIIVFALIIGFVIIMNINSYNMIDQIRNLTIFRSLGFQVKDISLNWFINSIFGYIISIIIGLPIGIILSKYILLSVSSDRREYVYSSGSKEILFTIILLFLYILISHILTFKKFKKVDIVEEMKERD